MTVGAVSSINYASMYSTSVEYNYFGATISSSKLQALMQQYGIKQTGDSETDLRALYNAMYADAQVQATAQASSASSSSTQQSQAQSSVPWANIMAQVGLSATGELGTDLEAFNQKINEMQVSFAAVQSQEGMAFVNQLSAEAAVVFVQQTQSANVSTSQPAQASGSDITALLNKMFVSYS